MGLEIRRDYPLGQRVNDDPLIHVFEDYLSEIEMAELITAAQSNLQQALVTADQSGIVSKGRTGRNCWVRHHQTPVISALSQRISELVDIPLENAESLQVIHYGETQEYGPHYDAWDSHTERGKRCMQRGGQRLVTCLLYLSDVLEGGGTCFPQLDMEVRAIRGRMVLFHNCHAGTNVKHEASLHGGMPVLQGEKWACNLWFREKSCRRPPTAKPSPGQFKRVI